MTIRSCSTIGSLLFASLIVSGCGSTSTVSVTGPASDKCQVAVTAHGALLDAAGGTGAITVTTQPECAWTASSDATWIMDIAPTQGQGSGSVEFRAAPNPNGTPRESAVVVNGQRATIRQSAAACTIAAASNATQFASTGGTGTITVTTLAGCAWTVTASQPWIAAASGSRTGSGTANFTVAPNTGSSRTATIFVGGAPITINQAGATGPAPTPTPPPPNPPATCSATLQPVSAAIPAAGGTGSVAIAAATGCAWSATTGAPWISFTTAVSGTGNGSIGYSVAANTSTTARSGSIAIAGASFAVNQAAAAPTTCAMTIDPTTGNFGSDGGTGSVAVTAPVACGWTASSTVGWVKITAGASGAGNGTVTYAVADYNGNGVRTGAMTIAGQTFTVTQKK